MFEIKAELKKIYIKISNQMALNISADEMCFEHSAFLWNLNFGPV